MMSCKTSVSNKQKQTEDRKSFVVSNIVSIVSSPSNKADQNEFYSIKDLLQCNMSIAYRWVKKASTKCGHFIAQVHNIEVKWFIKPCIVRGLKLARH